MATLNLSFPANPISAFSPLFVEIQVIGTDASAFYGRYYDVVFNGITIRRYFDSVGVNRLPLQGILQSFFVNLNFGVLPTFTSSIGDDFSKLFANQKEIVITAYPSTGTSLTSTFNIDAIFSVLQPNEIEPAMETIYKYGYSQPLYITQTKGSKCKIYYNGTSDVKTGSYGREIRLSDYVNVSKVEFLNATDDILKTYNVIECSKTIDDNSIYVRWIDKYGTFKFYMLSLSSETEAFTSGITFNKDTLYSQIGTPVYGAIQSRIQIKNRAGNKSFIAGVKAADELLLRHMRSLNGSLKQWYNDGTQWIEIILLDSAIRRDVLSGNPTVEFEFSMSPLYVQSL